MSHHHDTMLRVRYAETDQMGYVYYGNYYTYFEVGRVEYMRARGVAYKEMEINDDSYIVVAESQCRNLRPARYDDLLRIRTRVAELRSRTIRFAYEVIRESVTRKISPLFRRRRHCPAYASSRNKKVASRPPAYQLNGGNSRE
jgi:acyl-CoA thioester hydrolase